MLFFNGWSIFLRICEDNLRNGLPLENNVKREKKEFSRLSFQSVWLVSLPSPAPFVYSGVFRSAVDKPANETLCYVTPRMEKQCPADTCTHVCHLSKKKKNAIHSIRISWNYFSPYRVVWWLFVKGIINPAYSNCSLPYPLLFQ